MIVQLAVLLAVVVIVDKKYVDMNEHFENSWKNLKYNNNKEKKRFEHFTIDIEVLSGIVDDVERHLIIFIMFSSVIFIMFVKSFSGVRLIRLFRPYSF